MADTPKAYAINAIEGAAVHIDDSSDDETFKITVVRDGAALEEHEGVTAVSLGSLASDLFSVEYIDPPTLLSD